MTSIFEDGDVGRVMYSTASLNPATSSRSALLRVSHHEAYKWVSCNPPLASVPASLRNSQLNLAGKPSQLFSGNLLGKIGLRRKFVRCVRSRAAWEAAGAARHRNIPSHSTPSSPPGRELDVMPPRAAVGTAALISRICLVSLVTNPQWSSVTDGEDLSDLVSHPSASAPACGILSVWASMMMMFTEYYWRETRPKLEGETENMAARSVPERRLGYRMSTSDSLSERRLG